MLSIGLADAEGSEQLGSAFAAVLLLVVFLEEDFGICVGRDILSLLR